jgi:hypothetical protein
MSSVSVNWNERFALIAGEDHLRRGGVYVEGQEAAAQTTLALNG